MNLILNKKILIITLIFSFITIFFSLDLISHKDGFTVELDVSSEKPLNILLFRTDVPKANFTKKANKRWYLGGGDSQKIIYKADIEDLDRLKLQVNGEPQEITINQFDIIGDKKINFFSLEESNKQLSGFNIINQSDNKLVLSIERHGTLLFDNHQLNLEQSKNVDFLLLFTLSIVITFASFLFFRYLSYKKQSLKSHQVAYIFIFFSLLIVPILKFDNRIKDPSENRVLALKTKLYKNHSFNNNFPKEFEGWLNDRFFLRSNIIKYYSKILTFINQRKENDFGFLGEDNWLFLGKNRVTEDFQNLRILNPPQMEKVEQNLLNREAFFNNLGIKYYTFITPDKNRIYGEFYPSYIKKKGPIGRAQELDSFLRRRGKINIIFPHDALMKAKNDTLVYWKADSHWNHYGAFIGYLELMKVIKKDFPDLKTLTFDDVNLISSNEQEYDLYGRLAQSFNFEHDYNSDQYITPRIKETDNNYSTIANLGVRKKDKKTKSDKPLRVIIFRDSFTNNLEPYISSTFGEVWYIWDYNIAKYKNQIIQYNPDIVIHQMVERSIENGLLHDSSYVKEEEK